jgi:hypothetical protein
LAGVSQGRAALMFRKWLSPPANLFVDGVLLALFMAAGTFIGYAFVSREPPVQVLDRQLRSLTPNPQKGETFDYATNFVRIKWCETKVNRWFVDSGGNIVNRDPLPYSMRTDGLFYPQSSVTKVEIPTTLPSGPTEWCFRPEWKCNWTQQEWMWPGPILGPQECITFWINNPELPYEPVR